MKGLQGAESLTFLPHPQRVSCFARDPGGWEAEAGMGSVARAAPTDENTSVSGDDDSGVEECVWGH